MRGRKNKQVKLQQRRSRSKKRKARKNKVVMQMQELRMSYYEIFIAWLRIRYEISELELMFGSLDFTKAALLEVVRAYLAEMYEKHTEPNEGELETALTDVALNAYFEAHGIDKSDYIETTQNLQEQILKQARRDKYGCLGFNDKERVQSAQPYLDSNDLRCGTAADRNAKRWIVAEVILEELKKPKKERKNDTDLAKEKKINRDTVRKIRLTVLMAQQLGLQISPEIVKERKRGRKPNPFAKISKEAFNGLLAALETTPDAFGLEHASWLAETIQIFLSMFYEINAPIDYIYRFLHAHDIVSKSASRKNPKAKPEEVTKFKAELFEKFRRAIQNGETIVFIDETHVQQGGRQHGYALRGKQAFYSTNTSVLHCDARQYEWPRTAPLSAENGYPRA